MKTFNRILGKVKLSPALILFLVFLTSATAVFAYLGEWLYAVINLFYFAIIYVYGRALFRVQMLTETNKYLAYINEMQADAINYLAAALERPRGKTWDIFYDLPDCFTMADLQQELDNSEVRSTKWKLINKWTTRGLIRKEEDRYIKIHTNKPLGPQEK